MGIEDIRADIRDLFSGPGRSTRWILNHLDYSEANWCLIYPFPWELGHYPKYRSYARGKKNYFVHRIMCTYRHGEPPSSKHHSSHSCDRGTDGCVNPMHVSWKTPSQNQADRFKAGGHFQRERLTAEVVAEIKKTQGIVPPADLARQFGTTPRNIRLIFAGQAWKDSTPKGRLFTPEEVIEIRACRDLLEGRRGLNAITLAKRYEGATACQIRRILQGRSYGWVKDPFAGAPLEG